MKNHTHIPPILINITYISFSLLIIMVTFFPHQSHSQSPPPQQQPQHQPQPVYNYQICRDIKSYNCGSNSNISYPFWEQNPPFYCGAGDLHYRCHENITPTIQLSSQNFTVLDINTKNHTIKLKRTYQNICSPQFNGTSLSPTSFRYPPSVKNITIYYNCTSTYSHYLPENSLCGSHYPSFGHVGDQDALFRNDRSLKCQKHVIVPVGGNIRPEDDYFERGELERVLNEAFEVKYIPNKECLGCLGTEGGNCSREYFDKYVHLCNYDNCPNGPIDYSSPCSSPQKTDPWNWKRKLVIGLASGVLGAALAVITVIYFYKRRKNTSYAKSYVQSHSFSSDPSSRDIERGSQHFGGSQNFGVQPFTYSELQEATNNFDPSKELGEGGFGTVYYGKLHDGRSVAVKRLYENNYRRVEQFMNEVKILARLVHPNLVSLYGCTSRHSRELLLVYEYVSNGTVADHLHGKKAKHGKLSWHVRMNIAVETASALKYLHVSDIIHRDIKTNNILLDAHFRVKVADFGLSRLFPNDQTHVSTAPQGTPGYVDPEYHECYQLTDRSDVYSFGVVMIELISSLPAVDITRHRHEINLANMAINRIQNRTLHEIVDPTLGFESDSKVKKMIHAMAELAFQCLQSSKDMRPSMDEVLETLKDIQSDGKHKSQPEVIDISNSADEAVLLNHDPPPLSPDSNILSNYTTPNASG